MPTEPNWHISPDFGLHINTKNGLYEIPIAMMPVNLIFRLNRRIKKMIYKKEYRFRAYNHTGYSFPSKPVKQMISEKIRAYMNPLVLTFDREYYTVNTLKSILNYNLKKYKDFETFTLCLISHPKSMGNYHLKLMEDFLICLNEEYKDFVELKTYQSILK